MKNASALLGWHAAQASAFGQRVLHARHGLCAREDLFSDEALADLLDRSSASKVKVNTMGEDPADLPQWAYCERAGLGGGDLLRAVRCGRLWVNVVDVGATSPGFAAVLDELRSELQRVVPGLRIDRFSGKVLISSPSALVHFHADPEPNALWHVRGVKEVRVYPALDPRLAPTEALERIFTGEAEEELPYEAGFDEAATVIELRPGEVASWPQNSPHRITNVSGLNVSLNTSFWTPEARRRASVWGANRFFRVATGLPLRSRREEGAWPAAKATAFRTCRRLGLGPTPASRPEPAPRYRVDPDAPLGRVALAEAKTVS